MFFPWVYSSVGLVLIQQHQTLQLNCSIAELQNHLGLTHTAVIYFSLAAYPMKWKVCELGKHSISKTKKNSHLAWSAITVFLNIMIWYVVPVNPYLKVGQSMPCYNKRSALIEERAADKLRAAFCWPVSNSRQCGSHRGSVACSSIFCCDIRLDSGFHISITFDILWHRGELKSVGAPSWSRAWPAKIRFPIFMLHWSIKPH